MIDCGIPFKKMKEDLYLCRTLLLTHAHSDHVKPETLHRIIEEFPAITIYGNADVAYQYHVDKVIGSTPFNLPKQTRVIPIELQHDVPCTGFIIQRDRMQNILYATDTSSIDIPDGIMLDYCFLESNYDEDKLRLLAKKYTSGGYDPVLNAKRHLSTQQCKGFYYMHRRDADSPLIELHMSRRFY